MPICDGNSPDHCCYTWGGQVCQYLEENTVPGRRWACGLFRIHQSWEAVYATSEYKQNVKPFYERIGYSEIDCGTWPPPGKYCATCEITG